MDNKIIAKIAYHEKMAADVTLNLKFRDWHASCARALNRRLSDYSPPPMEAEAKANELLVKKRGMVEMSDNRCTTCRGGGRTFGRSLKIKVCNCVYRKVCRVVLWKCVEFDCSIPRIHVFQRSSGLFCEYRAVDFRADVDHIAQISLSKFEYLVYRRHLVDRLPWAVCLKVIPEEFEWKNEHLWDNQYVSLPKLDRGRFFHTVYKVTTNLGRAFLAHDLFPFHKYFFGHRVRFNADKVANSKPRGVFLGGSAWEEFRDNPQWSEQYASFIKTNPHLKPGVHPWRASSLSSKRPSIPVYPPITPFTPPPVPYPAEVAPVVPEAQPVVEAAKPKPLKARPSSFGASYRKSIVGKGKGELPGTVDDIRQITNEYARQFGFVTKDYQWNGNNTLWSVRADGTFERAVMCIRPLSTGLFVFDQLNEEKSVLWPVESLEEGRTLAEKLIADDIRRQEDERRQAQEARRCRQDSGSLGQDSGETPAAPVQEGNEG